MGVIREIEEMVIWYAQSGEQLGGGFREEARGRGVQAGDSGADGVLERGEMDKVGGAPLQAPMIS